MTSHTTEQERAEFEAWWRGYTKSTKAPRFEGGAYIFPAANTAWNTWQAARRAQVVPQGWKLVPNEATPEMLEQVWYLGYDEMRDAYCVLVAAAPHPPEVDDGPSSCAHCGNPWGETALVQLPDCAGKVLSDPDYDDGSISWRGGMPPAAGAKLYTEHQVLAILAQHGIKTK